MTDTHRSEPLPAAGNQLKGTGRLVVTFSPARWGIVRAQLAALVGGHSHIATRKTRLEKPLTARRAPVKAFPPLGVAVVDPTNGVTHEKLAAIGRVRDEHVLRRPRPHFSVPDAGPGLWSDDRDAHWHLRAIGIHPEDQDGAGIVVGVIDSGISASHPALAMCVLDAKSFVPNYPGDVDDLGHGTHVAGLIAGSPRERPRYGVAPAAKIRGYRIYGKEDATDEATMLHAVETAANDGCHVLVLATGRPAGNTFCEEDALLGSYVAGRGCLLFAAAGNESMRPLTIKATDAPGDAPRIYAIGAHTREGQVWTKSNVKHTDPDRRVDWGAPGQHITSALANGETIAVSGTSAACAVAAGAAAVVWSRCPGASGEDVVSRLNSLAAQISASDVAALGGGLIRVAAPAPSAPARAPSPGKPRPFASSVTPSPSRGAMTNLPSNVTTNGNSSLDTVLDGAMRLRSQLPGAHIRVVMLDILPDGAGAPAVVNEPPPALNPAETTVATTNGITVAGMRELQVKWNMSGHSVIALLAEQVLQKESPDVYQKLQDVMESAQLPMDDQSGMSSLAAWPDRIKAPTRGTPKAICELGQQHKPDHYINLPYTPPGKPNKLPKPMDDGQNVLTALPKWIAQLKKGTSAEDRLEALAFVMHLTGDLHQPLHCAVLVNEQFPNGDEGGNNIWFNKSGELHALWDSAIVASAGQIPQAVARLQKRLDRKAFKADLQKKKLSDWAMDTYRHACTAYDDFLAACAYQGEATRNDRHGRQVNGQQYAAPPPTYHEKARTVSEECALLAAFRLADLLSNAL